MLGSRRGGKSDASSMLTTKSIPASVGYCAAAAVSKAAPRAIPASAALKALGIGISALASFIISLAQTQTELLAGRALQGLASAFAVPSTLAAVDTGAPPERRTAAIGAWTGFLMLGFSIGPLFGGTLTHFVGWRAIFWCNVLLVAVGQVVQAAASVIRCGISAEQRNTPLLQGGVDAPIKQMQRYR